METREERKEQLVREALRDSLGVARRVDLDEVETDDLLAAAEVEFAVTCRVPAFSGNFLTEWSPCQICHVTRRCSRPPNRPKNPSIRA